ncbi:CRISPR-associated endonuclease Cas2 [Bombilactobacillus bombi]|uniref:CRISPR-associated endonuclease Cas2 n=1 Tax=Bombilactobacillus bombi TaxID=1303590 RepID=UPI000E58AAEE|nr:CRISPR-associated endonuclease Cas2 [Bombilactobacillus bombi]AXX64988.1 CRISPR-associated endonuclease Cas2 [Bombilactobacillus bombi]
MRLIIMFDLPVETSTDRRNYRQFRKVLINEGFLMIQESIYGRIAVNKPAAEFMEERIAKQAPPRGLVQSLIITEKQYANIRYLTGQDPNILEDKFERLTII